MPPLPLGKPSGFGNLSDDEALMKPYALTIKQDYKA